MQENTHIHQENALIEKQKVMHENSNLARSWFMFHLSSRNLMNRLKFKL